MRFSKRRGDETRGGEEDLPGAISHTQRIKYLIGMGGVESSSPLHESIGCAARRQCAGVTRKQQNRLSSSVRERLMIFVLVDKLGELRQKERVWTGVEMLSERIQRLHEAVHDLQRA